MGFTMSRTSMVLSYKYSVRPASLFRLGLANLSTSFAVKKLYNLGFRISAPINKTFLFVLDNIIDRLVDKNVLPSPGTLEVTKTILLLPFCSCLVLMI